MKASSDDRARPNLEAVAARAGVSRATVSRVVNGLTTVDPRLRARVEKAVDELGYVPNQAARALMTRRTNAVALLVSEPDVRVFSDPFFSGIVRGVSQEINAAGLQLVLLMAQTAQDLHGVERFLKSAPVDGALLISEHAADDPLPGVLVRSRIPFVIGGRPLQPDIATSYVDYENLDGARIAAQHLVSIGRTVIGTVAAPQDMSAGIDRLQGFKKGLGRSFRASRVEHGDFTQRSGDEATTRLLERVPDVDGLFAASDLMALGAISALRRSGRRVPEDVAVVGFDDNVLAATAEPPLTTVRQDPVLQGRMMVRLYLAQHRPDIELVADEEVPSVTGVDHVILPVTLVVRESA
ncbi:MAG: LacI family DNA-binding transcriptional regulator [Actinomycetes bacterium]